jgi:hypothetical protein
MPPEPSPVRFKVDPRDVPMAKAARRLHLTEAQFAERLPKLYARGFPQPDQTTGMFDLVAIDRWTDLRHEPRLRSPEFDPPPQFDRPMTIRERVQEITYRDRRGI